ncbi:LptF/LptG family permease, partial [Myxococcota bacterium]|nr:LptF/LptG family permease [Myxococcota bacterium]
LGAPAREQDAAPARSPRSPRGRAAAREGLDPGIRARRWALPRYVALRFSQLALLSLTALAIAYLLVDVLERLQWFARHAASFDEIAHFYSARIPLLVSRVTPMGLVVAMALTVSLLTSTGELVGMRSLGISSRRALLPALGLCLLATPLSFALNDQIVPRTNELADLIKQRDIKQESTESDRSAFWALHGRTLYQLQRLDLASGAGRDLIVYDLLGSGLPARRIDAKKARRIGAGHWQLDDATAVRFDDPARLESAPPPASVDLGDGPAAELDLMHLSVAETFALIREVAAEGESTTELEVDLHVKLATPLACFLLPALIMMIASTGPPFPGSALTVILAGVIAVAYTLLTGASASFARGGAVAPWLGGWAPDLLVASLLVGLTWRSRFAGRSA